MTLKDDRSKGVLLGNCPEANIPSNGRRCRNRTYCEKLDRFTVCCSPIEHTADKVEVLLGLEPSDNGFANRGFDSSA